MITENGRVVGVRGDKAWVQTIRASACESCSARSGCGQRVLAGASAGRANQVLVTNHLNAHVGDEVSIAIEESALLSASLLVYAVPLILLVLGAVLGQQWFPAQDAGAVAGAIAGLAAGFAVARVAQTRSRFGYEPTLVDVQPAASPVSVPPPPPIAR